MPLRFLKKSRQYNVTSKNLYVISVHHLLDTSTTVDCTISSESKGQDCLDNVCQRLNIQQPEFFGLKYMVKGKDNEMKWIDLDRFLSRQLEKYAAGTKIFLRVRHYVKTGVQLLNDEVTRYCYFLQLKNDIFESKITCDIKTAILLALYCRQAEYDSDQHDKQTQDCVKKALVLPKNLQGLASDDNLLDSLIIEVLKQNSGIHELNQSQAEEMYIQCCQQLEGYGEVRFQAKDILGNDLLLGLAINGMTVNAENGRQYFPWRDFNTVTIDKKTIKIEQNKSNGSIVGSFIFSEADTARYFWKLCIAQHKFFKRYIDNCSASFNDEDNMNATLSLNHVDINKMRYNSDVIEDSPEDISDIQQCTLLSPKGATGATILANGTMQPEFVCGPSLPHKTQYGVITPTNFPAFKSSNISLTTSHQSNGGNEMICGNGNSGQSTTCHSKECPYEYMSSSQHLSNSILDTRLQSNSCLDLSNNNLHGSSAIIVHNNNDSQMLLADGNETERLKSMLPIYRPAPDYETAVQLKYHTPSVEIQNLKHRRFQNEYVTPVYYSGSQPDIHNVGFYPEEIPFNQLAPQGYPDVTAPASHAHKHINASFTPVMSATHSNTCASLGQRVHIIRSNPPPVYPVNRLSSSSTPDLALASHRLLQGGNRAYVSGSSPDLVSNRNFLSSQYQYSGQGGVAGGGPTAAHSNALVHQYTYLTHIGHSQIIPPHSTFENLNIIEEQSSIVSQLRTSDLCKPPVAQSSRQRFEQQSPTSMPSGYRPNLNQSSSIKMTLPLLQRTPMNASIEPIYENVPLPHYTPQSTTPPIRNSENRSSDLSIHLEDNLQHIQQQQWSLNPQILWKKQQIQSKFSLATKADDASVNINKYSSNVQVDRAGSTDLQCLEQTPQRVRRAASAAPSLSVNGHSAGIPLLPAKVTPPPRQNRSKLKNSTSVSAVDVVTRVSQLTLNSTQSHVAQNKCYNNQLSAINSMPAFSPFHASLEKSASNAFNISTQDNKRKKRWNILGRNKTPEKKKSATLGREKASNTSEFTKSNLIKDDQNLPHRWSTGAPKLHSISGRFSKDTLCQILVEKLNDPQLFMEFERIPKRRKSARYDCALLNENANKNYDPNFLPYDDNRVRITPTMDNRHGYVNASHITSTVGSNQRFYILAQYPHSELTTRIFWQCVWEADVYLIVQLSEDMNYIPSSSNQHMEFGQFQVYQEFSQTTERCVTSKIRLYHIQSRRYRSVWLLNYLDWAEQNCPTEVNNFCDFLEELNSVRRASINEVPPGHNTNPPVLIHCLEGGGRSGLTLTADLLLYTLDHNEDLDIPRVIGELRDQRNSIIPSLAQYKFIYNLLIAYLKRIRLI